MVVWYSYLVRKPIICILIIAGLCCVSIVVSLFGNLPDFSDPTLGFETRGTSLSIRLITWQNLLQSTGLTKALKSNPINLYISSARSLQLSPKIYVKHKRKRKYHKNKKRTKHNNKKHRKKSHHTKSDIKEENYKIIHNKNAHHTISNYVPFKNTNSYTNVLINDNQTLQQDIITTDLLDEHKAFPFRKQNMYAYFCDAPNKMFSRFVVKHIIFKINSTESLFDLSSFLAQCYIQEQITSVPNYKEYCQRDTLSNCCQPWSLASYAAYLANKRSCFDLTNDDVRYLKNLLLYCFEYYQDYNNRSDECITLGQCPLPEECSKNNVAINIIQYIIDDNFMQVKENAKYSSSYSMIFIPVIRSAQILPLFHEWQKLELSNQFVQIVGMDLGLENELFNELLLTDVWLIALGGIFIMFCMWLYTSSIFLTIMTCIAVIFSIGLAYFIYTTILNMTFFPYMNLLAVVVIVGIGADDAFIFIKIWHCISTETLPSSLNTNRTVAENTKKNSRKKMEKRMILTVQHATVSMFVTTITTAGAFFASYTSYITAVKCFSIFAATAVITNYLLMLTWLPASLSYMEYMKLKCHTMDQLSKRSISKLINKTITSLSNLLETYITGAIFNYAHIFILIFGLLGITGMIIVLYKPGLQLPDNSHIQLFASHHPFEMYHSELKQLFWFERITSDQNVVKLPIYFVWGIKHVDDGDYTNPFAYGNLQYDENFVVYTKEAQTWILRFCENIKQQSFYESSLGQYSSNCFMETFVTLMNRTCLNYMDGIDYTPCCNVSSFPYEKNVFELCLPQIISLLYNTPRKYFIPTVAGPKFKMPSKDSNDLSNASENSISSNTLPLVKAVVIEAESNFPYTTKYNDIKEFIQFIEDWFNQELKTAPYELQGGWFISDLKFFDLQDSLYKGTLVAITLAMCISIAVLFLFTCNVLIAFYAVITILLAIFVTIAILVLIGWKLNILESIIVSAAIGLTVDFSLHYSIHYRLSPNTERLAAACFALKRIISPTAMAAFTTAVPGVLVLFSNVLPFIQIGTFLLIMMVTSWLYGTFFLMSLLKVLGPQNNFMQLSFVKKWRRRSSLNNANEIMCNDIELMSPNCSIATNVQHNEAQEMESLAKPDDSNEL